VRGAAEQDGLLELSVEAGDLSAEVNDTGGKVESTDVEYHEATGQRVVSM
jgi:hypothetical protein